MTGISFIVFNTIKDKDYYYEQRLLTYNLSIKASKI